MSKKKLKNLSITSLILGIALISFLICHSERVNITWAQILGYVRLSSTLDEEKDYIMGVHFLNVGKADCSYIKCGNANILIDSGDREVSPNTVKYLNRRGIKKLDLVIATHPHRDHIGQMFNVIDNFEIGCFVMSKVPLKSMQTSDTYNRMLLSLQRKNVNVRLANPGDTIKISDLTVHILGPCRVYENLNDDSVVAKITYGTNSFLFMGDAEKTSEQDLIRSKRDLRAEVLKVGHHGSKTSTIPKFLQKVKPKYAVISSGPSKFGLPKQEVIERLISFNIEIYRTDMMGDVSFLTNGGELKLVSQNLAA